MYYSNITTGTPYKHQKPRTFVQALRAMFRKAFYYSAEDKFIETKKAADQLEALHEFAAEQNIDVSELEPQTPKFTFWV